MNDVLRAAREDWSAVAPVILYDAQGRVTATLTANEFKRSRTNRCRRHRITFCDTCRPAMPDRVTPDPTIAMTWLEQSPARRSAIARRAATQRWQQARALKKGAPSA